MITEKITLKSITLVVVFATLCYVSRLFSMSIYSPENGTISLFFGAIAMLLAALFIGGFTAGISASLGFGLYDMMNGGSNHAPVVFISWLLLGILVGFVCYFIKKKENLKTNLAYVLGIVLVGIGLIYTFVVVKLGFSHLILSPKATLTFHWVLLVFPYVIGIALIALSFLEKKLPIFFNYLLVLLIVCATFIIGEALLVFIINFIFGLADYGFQSNVVVSYFYLANVLVTNLLISTIIIVLSPIAKLIKEKYQR